MQIVEKNIVGKAGTRKCEDAIITTEAFAAVVDGSTSKSCLPPLECGLTHGQIAAECVCEYISSCDENIDKDTFCLEVTDRLREKYMIYRPELSMKHLAEHPEDRFTCSAIVYSAHRNEIWMIGDCHCMLIEKVTRNTHYFENNKPMEAVLAARRSECIERLLADGAEVDELRVKDKGRENIINDLRKSMIYQNREYAVIDGFPIPMEKITVVPTNDAEELILASDGYPWLYPTLAESESRLQQLLKEDPLLIRSYQATKGWHPDNVSFDDRSYLRISLD